MSVEISLLVVTEFDAVSARFASMADLVTRANATSHAFFVRPARVVTCLPSTTIRHYVYICVFVFVKFIYPLSFCVRLCVCLPSHIGEYVERTCAVDVYSTSRVNQAFPSSFVQTGPYSCSCRFCVDASLAAAQAI